MASPTQWTGVWASSGSCWRTGKPGVLQSMGSQRAGHNWAAEQQWQRPNGWGTQREEKACSWSLERKRPLPQHFPCLSEEVMENMWPPGDPWAGSGEAESPHPPPLPWMYILPMIPAVGAVPRTQPWEGVLLRPSRWYMWLDPVKGSA